MGGAAAPAPVRTASPKRSAAYRLLRFLVVALLVAYVLHRARLTSADGWTDLLHTLRASNLGFLAASMLFTPVIQLQSTLKWHSLTRAKGLNVSFRQLYYFFVVGRFYNLVLPSNIGGDLLRVRMLGVATGRHADAAATVVVERLTGVIVLTMYAAMALAIAAADLQVPWLFPAVALVGAMLVLVCWALLDDRPVRMFTTLLQGHSALTDKLMAKLVRLHGSIAVFRDVPAVLVRAFGHSAVFYLLAVVNIWLTVRVFHSGAELPTMLVAVPIVMFLMNIPLSVGNVGIMEFAYTVVLGAFGVSPAAAVSTVMLMRIKAVLAAAGGGIVHALAGPGSASAEAVRAVVPDAPKA